MRRLAAAVAATALVALAAAPAAGARDRPATQAPAVTVRGLEQTAWVTREGDWMLKLAIDGAPPGSTVTADLYARVADHTEYGRSILTVFDGDPLPSLPDVDLDDATLRADGSREVMLAVSLRREPPAEVQPGWRFFEAGLRPGVYPVDIRVVDADGNQLQRLVTHITRIPSAGDPTPTSRRVLVAPIVTLGSDDPSVDVDGSSDLDPDVARSVEDLDQGLGMFPDLPLTLVPRPESIEALAREEATADTLDTLRGIARARQVVDGTYVEVPIGPWVAQGLTDELSRQRDRGNSVLTEQLGRADSSTWDGRSGLTPAAAAALWPVGVRSVILTPGALGDAPVTGPVSIPVGPQRSLEAVVPDPGISGALGRHRDDPVLNAAAFASELALVAADPEGARGVVVEPPEGWLDDPSNVALLGQLLLDPAAPVEPVTVAQLLERVPATTLRELAPTLPIDLDGYPERLGLARGRLSSYASLVGAADPQVASLDQLLLLSGAMSLTPGQRSDYVEEVLARTEEEFQAIRAPDRQTVTLTSSDGDLPLTLLNELDVPVTVRVDLRPNGRVEIRDFSPTQTLEPGTNQLSIPVHARAPGDAKVDVTILTTDEEIVLDEVDYTVRSTAVPGIGVVLSVGAVAFLLVWWARHWLRGRRAPGGGGGGGGGGGPDGPAPQPEGPPGSAVPAPPEQELVAT